MNQLPDARLLPVAQTSPTSHARAVAHFLRQHLPWDSTAQDEYNTSETRPVCQTRPSTLWIRLGRRDKWLDQVPQCVRQYFVSHRTPQSGTDPTISTVWLRKEVLLELLKNNSSRAGDQNSRQLRRNRGVPIRAHGSMLVGCSAVRRKWRLFLPCLILRKSLNRYL
jgi:hypothetical protein